MVWYDGCDSMRLYATVWDSNAMEWYSNAMVWTFDAFVWEFNALLCYDVVKKYAWTDCTGHAFCSTFYKTGYKEYYQRVYRPVYYCCTGYILVNNQCVRKFPTFTNVPVHY